MKTKRIIPAIGLAMCVFGGVATAAPVSLVMDSKRTVIIPKEVTKTIQVQKLDSKGVPMVNRNRKPVMENKKVTEVVNTPTSIDAYGAAIKITIDGKEKNTMGGTFSGMLGNAKMPLAYCIDLFHGINPGSSYTANVTFDGTIADRGTINNAGKVAWLMTHKGATVGYDREVQSAFQAAIWKQVYADRFELLGTNTAKVLTAYNGYLSALGNNVTAVNKVAWIDPYSGTVSAKNPLGATGNQDLVAVVTPIPGAVWLFGSALVGLVGLGKRKGQKTVVAM